VLLGCIADDFTGATDLANTLSKAGMACVQINGLKGCSEENSTLLSHSDAAIVALKTRSIDPVDAIEQSLAALDWLQAQGCEKFFFKYCSTFDSTQKGNIGPVAEALMAALGTDFTIACPAAPENGRTVYNGHLFVDGKLLSDTGMRHHPITPMTDPNLVRVLARQSVAKTGLIEYLTIDAGPEAIAEKLTALRAAGYGLAITDALSPNHLRNLAAGTHELPLITGGSGLALGLPDLYRDRALFETFGSELNWPQKGGQLVISGSCSETTLRQISEMKKFAQSFQLDPGELQANRQGTLKRIDKFLLKQTTSPALIYSSADLDSLAKTHAALGQEKASALIEDAMGEIACNALRSGVRKLVVAGGETAGAIVSALGFDALAIGPEIAPGVPWTLGMKAPHVALALKSGNFGGPNFFTRAFQVLP
jgi:uncharacterized protein YgbK (DUF1537 family)